jgi:hypothetical protein
MPEWKSAEDIDVWKKEWIGLALESDLPPPLPPLPLDIEEVLQEDKVGPAITSVTLGPSENDFFDRTELTTATIKDEKVAAIWTDERCGLDNKKIPWALVLTATIFFSLTIYLLYPRYQLQDLDVQGVSQTDYSKFLELSKNSSNYQFAGHLAMSIDGERIWMGVNKSGPLFLRLRLKSVVDQVLPPAEIDILSEFHTEKFATMVDNYKLLKGNQMHPGYYKVQIEGQGVGIFSKLIIQLKKLPLLSMLPFVEQYQRDFSYQGTYYLGSLSESIFKEKLLAYQKESKDKEQKPLIELIEFYRTFDSLYQRLEELYATILGQINTGTQMRLFEKEYVVAIAPIYQSMMMEIAEKKARRAEGQNLDEIQFIAREFGLLAADFLSETQKLKTIDQLTKTSLKTRFAARVKKYRDVCNEQIKILQGYL